jgi:IrrE N-terminal-like domain
LNLSADPAFQQYRSKAPLLAALLGDAASDARAATCACRKLNRAILVMQSAQDWATKNVPGAIDGAQVLYRRLVGCEAQIIGFKDRAIIYVSDGARPNRKRFSTGHELGHWHHHRGQSFVCRSEDIGRPLDERSRNAERMADVYSADLILPPYLIKPKLHVIGETRSTR